MFQKKPAVELSLWCAGALALCGSLTACVETVPPEMVEAIETLDRDLLQLRAAEVAPGEYASFAHQWVRLRTRVEAEEDTLISPDGAEHPSEFFAYATEVFFEAPADLKAEHPRLYDGLKTAYGLDPAAW